jgi:hypothetical protein
LEPFDNWKVFLDQYLENEMSNLDNQPGRDNRAGLDTRTPRDRAGLDNRRSGIGAGTITGIVAALVIGALMLFGPWGSNNRSAVNNSPATSNSTAGTTTGQTSSAPTTNR